MTSIQHVLLDSLMTTDAASSNLRVSCRFDTNGNVRARFAPIVSQELIKLMDRLVEEAAHRFYLRMWRLHLDRGCAKTREVAHLRGLGSATQKLRKVPMTAEQQRVLREALIQEAERLLGNREAADLWMAIVEADLATRGRIRPLRNLRLAIKAGQNASEPRQPASAKPTKPKPRTTPVLPLNPVAPLDLPFATQAPRTKKAAEQLAATP